MFKISKQRYTKQLTVCALIASIQFMQCKAVNY